MQAPVINKNQKQKVIGKKIVKKKSVRNVLSRPKTSTWPLVTEEDAKVLLLGLKEIFYYKHNVKIKWKDLKNVSKEQRKQKRREIQSKLGKEERPEILKSVIFGVNAIMRGLEKHSISSVLISADVNPLDMVKHIWSHCTNLHIPIIAVPSLRQTMNESVGFPAAIFGLKKVSPDSPLNKIYNLTCELSTKFTGENYPYVEKMDLDDTTEEIVLSSPERNTKSKNVSKKCDFILYRNNLKERCFVPPRSKDVNKPTSDWNTDFISFTNDSEPVVSGDLVEEKSGSDSDENLTLRPLEQIIEKVNQKSMKVNAGKKSKRKENRSKYLPVNIKRLQSNPNRKKK